mmetsp:Transcript_1196/g.2778  ORF Transcript_1196/g.2778 Transcript_1196/m.2778 type:complete len:364 (-) Transcript_1196:117-1208(-)|eukprot:jgi/Tetstr1/456459/TSEL_043183.t1
MNAAHLEACSFPEWYPLFREHTFASQILPLNPAAVEYLLADGVFLPDANTVYPTRGQIDPYADEDDYQRWPEEDQEDGDSDGGGDGEEGGAVKQVVCFPELEAAMRSAIEELGGRVVPKLNWSCPKDATWVSQCQTLACSSPGEVLLLLKSSDRAAHDLSAAWQGLPGSPPPPVLVLREFFDLQPWMEFRCFVAAGRVVGISQRDVTAYFPELQEREDDIADAILTFHEQHVQGVFGLDNYVMDVYLSKKMRVYIMDFNPVGGTTQPLLFTWEELPFDMRALMSGVDDAGDGEAAQVDGEGAASSWTEGEVDVRFITEPVAIRPGGRAAYGVPFDFADTSEGSAVDALIKSMQAAEAAQQQGE